MEALIYLLIVVLSSVATVCIVWIYKKHKVSSNEDSDFSVGLSIIADNKNTSADIGEMQKDFKDIAKDGIIINYLINNKEK